jgi:hypothetical protein
VALATRLRVVERAESVGESLGFVELGLVGGVGGSVDEAVALIVEAGGGFGELRGERKKSKRHKHGENDQGFHGHLRRAG